MTGDKTATLLVNIILYLILITIIRPMWLSHQDVKKVYYIMYHIILYLLARH